MNRQGLDDLSDDQLLDRLAALIAKSRRVEEALVAHLGEVDRRRLYLGQACSSMFSYCTKVLKLSESEAYLRIAVARAARKHPVLLTMLGEGSIHLRGIATLAPHLRDDNIDEVLRRARGKTTRELEVLLAQLAPKPDVADSIRKKPQKAATLAQPTLRAQSCSPAYSSSGAGGSAPPLVLLTGQHSAAVPFP